MQAPSWDPRQFAERWVQARNDRDIEAVLRHYADDVLFTSPTAQRVVPETEGTVRGKEALRSYWTAALRGNPDLHFTLLGVYAGIDTIVLNYRNQAGMLINEVLTFREGLVATGHAAHTLTADASLIGSEPPATPRMGLQSAAVSPTP